MGLKVKTANCIKIDDSGYAAGIIAYVTFLDGDENEYEQEQFLFDFLVEGTKKSVNMKVWTRTKVSGQKYQNGSKTEYNKLTVLCLRLGLFSESELVKAYENGQDLDVDLDKLKGKSVKFKLLKPAILILKKNEEKFYRKNRNGNSR